MVGAIDIDGSNVISLGVVKFEQLVPQPGVVKGQFPLETPPLSSRAQLQGPCPLGLEGSVDDAGVGAFRKFDHVIE